jgi:hypothetical protein
MFPSNRPFRYNLPRLRGKAPPLWANLKASGIQKELTADATRKSFVSREPRQNSIVRSYFPVRLKAGRKYALL